MTTPKKINPPRLADRIFSWYCQNDLTESILGDLHERFEADVRRKGLFRARILYYISIILFINRYTLKRPKTNHSTTFNSIPMIKNYLLVAIRSLKRYKVYSAINIVGLAVGLASCFIIFSYVKKELTYDQFHRNGAHIYRVTNSFDRPNSTSHWARTPPALAPAISNNFPGIERATRLRYTDELLYTVGDQSFYQGNGFYADSLFLEMFDFPLKSGNKHTALDEPGSIVLTEAMAIKFFGNKNPVGQLLTLEHETTLKVTGILHPIPSNSHITFDLLISLPTYVVPDGYLADLTSWGWAGFWTYVELSQSIQPDELKSQILTLYNSNYKNPDIKIDIELQPLEAVYLDSTHYTNIGESVRSGSRASILGLSVIVILILAVASCNFMNLSTAMSFKRGKEIGIRKVLGAVKSKITRQFLIESMIVSLFSFCLALGLVLLFGPSLGQLFELGVDYSPSDLLKSLPIYILCTLMIGIIAGLYPSFVLATFSPILALKGNVRRLGSGTWLRNGLIVFQFVVAVGLIIATAVVVSQTTYMQNKSLGFDHKNVIKLRIGSENQHFKILKNKLLSNPHVLNMARASHSFDGSASSGPAWLKGQSAKDAHQLSYYQTDYDFLDVTDVQLLDGRFFSEDLATDSATALVLNQSAVLAMGLDSPLGQKINFHNRERTVIGVVEDFHFGSLHSPIGPIGIVMPFVNLEQLLIKVQGDDYSQIFTSLESDWHEIAGDLPFEAGLLEDGIQAMYEKEKKMSTLITAASSLAVILACLGLYALVAFTIQVRLKEIGIRKVLGAPVRRLVFLLAKQYIVLILIANLIAWPITYILISQWLDDFAYRIPVEPIIFVSSGVALFLISMATISYQLIHASKTNPVKFLRSE